MKITGEKRHFKKNLLAGPEVGPGTEHRIVVRSASPLEHLLPFFLSFFRSSFFYSLDVFRARGSFALVLSIIVDRRKERKAHKKK